MNVRESLFKSQKRMIIRLCSQYKKYREYQKKMPDLYSFLEKEINENIKMRKGLVKANERLMEYDVC